MKDKTVILTEESVINFYHLSHTISQQRTLSKIDDEYNVIRARLSATNSESTKYKWLNEGIICQLKQNLSGIKEWVDGRLRISIQFSFLDKSIKIDDLLRESEGWIEINANDVIVVDVEDTITSTTFFTFNQLIQSLRSLLQIADMSLYRYAWIGEGIPCKALISSASLDGHGWCEGKISLKIEFKADGSAPKTDESLDLIRNAIEAN